MNRVHSSAINKVRTDVFVHFKHGNHVSTVHYFLELGDITNGEKIAGTGTIEIDGSVGPVGGVKQKVIAAKRANASLILVPTANYLEASVFSDENTSIVAVDSFEEALDVISDFSSR